MSCCNLQPQSACLSPKPSLGFSQPRYSRQQEPGKSHNLAALQQREHAGQATEVWAVRGCGSARMGLLDKFRRTEAPTAAQGEIPSADLGASSSGPQQGPSLPGQDLLDSASISGSAEFSATPEISGRFYNPYEGLNASLDGRARMPYRS